MKEKIKNFNIDNQEILYRCYWIAWRIFNNTLRQFQMWHKSNWIHDDRYDPTFLPKLSLFLSYSTHFILDKISDETNTFNPNADDNWKFYIIYSVCFSNAYETFFEKYLNADKSFNHEYFNNLEEMLDGHTDVYNTAYEMFWNINPDTDYSNDINDFKWNHDYNVERICVFYLNSITPIVDKERAINHLTLYKNIGVPFFNDAFFDLSFKKIKDTLWD